MQWVVGVHLPILEFHSTGTGKLFATPFRNNYERNSDHSAKKGYTQILKMSPKAQFHRNVKVCPQVK